MKHSILNQGVISEDMKTITFYLDEPTHQIRFIKKLLDYSDFFMSTTIECIIVRGGQAKVKMSRTTLLKMKAATKANGLTP